MKDTQQTFSQVKPEKQRVRINTEYSQESKIQEARASISTAPSYQNPKHHIPSSKEYQ
jgi:hypothetical protein